MERRAVRACVAGRLAVDEPVRDAHQQPECHRGKFEVYNATGVPVHTSIVTRLGKNQVKVKSNLRLETPEYGFLDRSFDWGIGPWFFSLNRQTGQ